MQKLIACILLFGSMGAIAKEPAVVVQQKALDPYVANDYSSIFGMKGFSDDLLKMHLTLYEGYVKNINVYLQQIKEIERKGQESIGPDYSALKYRIAWEWDGMRLHEYYFDNLKGTGTLSPKTTLYKELADQYGSYADWKKQFIATGMMRGIGWVILYRDPQSGRLMNTWITEHNIGHLAGAKPLLVMDVWEHAYITEYGLDRKAYINAFFDNINWDVVSERYAKSLGQ